MLFIFDMDNVLYDYHWRVRMEALTAITGHDFHELRRRWWHDKGEWKAEAGQPDTGEEYLARVNDAFGSSITREHWLSLRREAMAFRPGVLPAGQPFCLGCRKQTLRDMGWRTITTKKQGQGHYPLCLVWIWQLPVA